MYDPDTDPAFDAFAGYHETVVPIGGNIVAIAYVGGDGLEELHVQAADPRDDRKGGGAILDADALGLDDNGGVA